ARVSRFAALAGVAGNSLERVPYWAELDRRAEKGAERRMLIVRPAVILRENTRYIVAMRNLKREDGGAVEPSPAFRRLRAGRTEGLPRLERRRRRFEEIFGLLEGAGVERESLTLAWDFHTASCRSLHGSMLRIRNRGYRAVGAKGPKLTIEEVVEFSKEEDDQVAMRVEGSFRVPKFVEKTSIRDDEGLVLARDSQGRPVQRGWKESPFWLTIPRGAPGGKAHGLMQYGHGLLGTGEQVESGHNDRIAARHDLLVFGSTLFGMSSSDVEFALRALLDISKFPFMSDRLHQGMLEYLLLARAMRERLESTEFARKHDIDVDENQLYYSGISQGGIFGGTYMALSRDVRRGHLGVPGNNYTTLLERSVDFTRYFRVLNRAYENRLDQLLAQALLGILWEQTDPVSYLRHVRADPFPDTPRHDVLLAAAQGDHQVAPITNEVAVRTSASS
ncbi:MAG: hypothetical protein ABEL76_00325, partial [Bradymonadaceae bacterium]